MDISKPTYLYLDINSFFASCEQQEYPQYRGKPIAVIPVAAESTCAIAASYEAKAFGVKTGTRVSDARKMCPGLQCIISRPKLYVAYHQRIIEAIETVIPIEAVRSIDEVVCHLTGRQREPEVAVAIGRALKQAIYQKVGASIGCSIGISTNRYLAKVASNIQKPDGLTVLLPQQLPHALSHLPLEALPGIGFRMARKLYGAGIHNIPALYALTPGHMKALWGGVGGTRFYAMLRGDEVSMPTTQTSSLSHQHVLEPNLRTPTGGLETLRVLTIKAAERLRNRGFYCGGIHVGVRLSGNGGTWEASRKCGQTQDTLVMLRHLRDMWKNFPHDGRPLRVGITLYGLTSETQHQPDLFTTPARTHVFKAVDAINQRYGRHTISFGLNPAISKQVGMDKIAFQRVPTLYET